MRRAEGLLEHGARPLPASALAPYLDDLDRLNTWFGGYALTVSAIRRMAHRHRALRGDPAHNTRPLLVADVGGSRGDLAARLARTRTLQPVVVVVVDRDETSLSLGQRARKDSGGLFWVQAEAGKLPFRAGAIDVVTTSLTLHHLEPDAAAAALAGMRRAARLGVIINDLLRSRLTHLTVWLLTRIFRCHPFARDDGPLSVRRAYSATEIERLATHAGFRRFAIRRHPLLGRLVAVLS